MLLQKVDIHVKPTRCRNSEGHRVNMYVRPFSEFFIVLFSLQNLALSLTFIISLIFHLGGVDAQNIAKRTLKIRRCCRYMSETRTEADRTQS
jgi:hypothetical protein